MRFKNIIAVLIVAFILGVVGYGAGDYHKYVIYDDAVTTTNDTLISAWIPLNGASNVALFAYTNDSLWVRTTWSFRYGQDDAVTTVADSIGLYNSLSVNDVGLSKGKILQGFGLATSLIPGANAIRITSIRMDGTKPTGKIHVGLVYGD